MTLSQVVSLVKEIRNLELLEMLFERQRQRPGADQVWELAVVCVNDRLRYTRYVASLEPPELIANAERLLAGEKRLDALQPPAPDTSVDSTEVLRSPATADDSFLKSIHIARE